MLKDTFDWHACVEKVEVTPCGGKVKVSLLGYNNYPFGGGISNGGSGEALAKEIAYCMNNGMRDNTDMYRLMTNSTYGGFDIVKDYSMFRYNTRFEIDDVIFNNPATIVKWKDGTKTVVKVQEGDEFDPMIGLAMCIAKKAMGNQGNYFEVFKKWCEPWYKEKRIQGFNETIMDGSIGEIFENIRKSLSRGFKEGLKVNDQKNQKDDERVYFAKATTPRVCLNCKYCVRHDDSNYCCTNANVINAGIKHLLFPDCSEWEAMPEPKNEGE